VKLRDIYVGVIPFMILQLIGMLIIAYWPQLVIWLPAVAYR
jgi:TRAP-type mannitol/chloroaromatic compound transport system permease large subunit